MKPMTVSPRLLELLEAIVAKELPPAPIGKTSRTEWYLNGKTDGEVMLARLVLRELYASQLTESFDVLK